MKIYFKIMAIPVVIEGTGMVKGESYDESGNLAGMVVLAEKF